MPRQFWFQLHWFLGITAGVVLAVVGVTGAMLSFEHELLRWMSPGIMTVQPPAATQGSRAEALGPDQLLEKIQTAEPGKKINLLMLSADPEDAARVAFADPKGGRRGEMVYVDPYTGELLGKPRAEAFFRTTMQVHRWLALGDTGKAIVGASTLALIYLSLSGLYLRWPRWPLNWRIWLKVNFASKGRGFLWSLHSVVGTWLLLFYLLAGLTGLYWSYDWYRDGLFALSGAPRPNAQQQSDRAVPAPSSSRPGDFEPVANIWDIFRREAGDFSQVTLRLPEGSGRPFQISYLDSEPEHARATNKISIDPRNGEILEHERYADKPLGAQLMGSMFQLHSGGYFGVPGTILMMLASLSMPLFAVTGWLLYSGRRRSKQATPYQRSPRNSA